MVKKAATAVKKASKKADERRVAVRYPCKLEALCEVFRAGDDTAHHGWIVDISTGGIGLFLTRSFKSKTRLAVKLLTTHFSRTLRAHVVHVAEVAPGYWLFGCAFDSELTADELKALLP